MTAVFDDCLRLLWPSTVDDLADLDVEQLLTIMPSFALDTVWFSLLCDEYVGYDWPTDASETLMLEALGK